MKKDELGNNELYLISSRNENNQTEIINFENNIDLFSKISIDRPKFIIGDKVKYKDKEYTIINFDELKSIKTVTIKDNVVYMGGYITGSDTIAYRNESDLDNIFINISQKKIS